jgi:hypothetical protein
MRTRVFSACGVAAVGMESSVSKGCAWQCAQQCRTTYALIWAEGGGGRVGAHQWVRADSSGVCMSLLADTHHWHQHMHRIFLTKITSSVCVLPATGCERATRAIRPKTNRLQSEANRRNNTCATDYRAAAPLWQMNLPLEAPPTHT